MIRVVLDSNILVSGLPSEDGVLADIMARWLKKRFTLVMSEHILVEVEVAWSKPYWQARLDQEGIDNFLFLLQERSEVVPLYFMAPSVTTHWQDDLVLATAISGDAECIVTGDKEFLRLRHYQEIDILSPRDFLTRLDETEIS